MNPQQFKQNRKDLKFTQKRLAEELGLSKKNGDVHVRKIESGNREASGVLIRCFELIMVLQELNLK
tara:strand:+ start:317 stop:514 length:198 start_codon:yes stop_codon:yes gene_type:complete